MIAVEIPGIGSLVLKHLVLDFNGTLACDGGIIPGVIERIEALACKLDVHVLTADTFGTCSKTLAGLPLSITILSEHPEDAAKASYVRWLGARACAAIGNGANDRFMVEAAGLGIIVMSPECSAAKAIAAADIVAPGILEALDLLLNPLRIKATLRT